jgi:hypothetical protein
MLIRKDISRGVCNRPIGGGAGARGVINIHYNRGKSPIIGRCPNMGRCIISHQEVLRPLLKNVNHQADETLLSSHCINGQLLRTSLLTGSLCFGAL